MNNMSFRRWSGRLAGSLAGSLAAVALVAGFAATPASAKAPDPAYIALGDSYVAGTGGGAYTAPPPGLPAQCLQTQASYPAVLGAALNLGCFGARTTDVAAVAAGFNGALAGASVVTITVGGNDVDTGLVAMTCTVAVSSPDCLAALHNSLAVKLPELPGKIRDMVAAVKAAAPDARIVMTGYPRLFTATAGLSTEQAQAIQTLNQASDLLNTTIAYSARANGVQYVSVANRFAGHGIGSADPWIVAPAGLCVPGKNCSDNPADTFHPTATGYAKGYAKALKAARVFHVRDRS